MAKILVVDDTPTNISLLTYLLEQGGHTVLTATDGIEALERVTPDVDVILMDVMMPRMDGIEATKKLKENPETQHIPVAILTAKKTSVQDKIAGLSTGADDYLTKPIDTKELVARVENLIRSREVHRRLDEEKRTLVAAKTYSDRKIEKLETINEISTTISSTLDLNQVLQITISKLVELMRVEQATLISVDRSQTRGHIRAAYNKQKRNPRYLGSIISLDQYPELVEALKTHKPVVIHKTNKINIVADGERYEEEVDSNETTLVLPLRVRQQNIGVITLKGRRTGTPFEKDDIEFCQVIANQSAIAIDNATLFTSLKSKNQQLKRLDKMKDDLVNMVVHDLRTPLTSVLGYLDIVLSGMAGDISDDARDCLDRAVESSQWLLKMINDLLDVTKFEEGKMTLDVETNFIGDVIDAAVAQVIGTARNAQIEIQVHVNPHLPAIPMDHEKIMRTLVNLIGNAIKFSEENSTVIIRAQLFEENEICVSVADQGRGIPKEYFSTIFEKFGQLKTQRTQGEKYSSGLGLTFCKLAIEAHHGKIWVESEVGKGSVFFFTLPVNPPGSVTSS
ncbi:MAG: response regulator [Gemmatimonadetes bacterium]|nr:MAG: response regulator [Gemmatimonadota bacterium]